MTYTQKDLEQARDNGYNSGFIDGAWSIVGLAMFGYFVYVFISIF